MKTEKETARSLPVSVEAGKRLCAVGRSLTHIMPAKQSKKHWKGMQTTRWLCLGGGGGAAATTKESNLALCFLFLRLFCHPHEIRRKRNGHHKTEQKGGASSKNRARATERERETNSGGSQKQTQKKKKRKNGLTMAKALISVS